MIDLDPAVILPRDLGSGLRLRHAAPADAAALAAFNARIHSERETPDAGVLAWTDDLMRGDHPACGLEDILVVENAAGQIVSSSCLIAQTWQMDSFVFGVGRPELVGTDPDYRCRGLVRAQFETMHARSEQRGDLMQAITGIPYYYRQFGYEMAVDLGGGRLGRADALPPQPADAEEAFRFRLAGPHDLPLMRAAYAAHCARSLINCVRDDALWLYELEGKSPHNVNRQVPVVIERAADGAPVGVLIHSGGIFDEPFLTARLFELKPGVSWAEVTPAALRHVWSAAQRMERDTGCVFKSCGFTLAPDHPAYAAAGQALPQALDAYAWYVRVPDRVKFLQGLRPVLESRLRGTAAEGITTDLYLNFYRSGLHMALRCGEITCVEPWQPTQKLNGDASFPDQTFLQLLLGYRSLSELKYAFADCSVRASAHPLLEALFPRRAARIWPVS